MIARLKINCRYVILFAQPSYPLNSGIESGFFYSTSSAKGRGGFALGEVQLHIGVVHNFERKPGRLAYEKVARLWPSMDMSKSGRIRRLRCCSLHA